MVDAVPIVMQKPGERAMPPSMSFHSCSVMVPAHRLVPLAQVQVAGIEFAPGVDDRDDRFAAEVLVTMAELFHPRPVAETTESLRTEPALAAKFSGIFRGHGDDAVGNGNSS